MRREVAPDGSVYLTGALVDPGDAPDASGVAYGGSTGLSATNVEAALDELDAEKAPLSHDHDSRYYTETEMNGFLALKSDTSHNHDSRYYTEGEVDTLLAGKSAVTHDHDSRYYTEAEVDAKIAAALSSAGLHQNPAFEIVSMSTLGNQNTGAVASRLMPDNWDWSWSFPTTALAYPTLVSDATVSQDGTGRSLKIDYTGTSNVVQYLWGSPFSAPVGALITVSAWVRANHATPTFDIGIITANSSTPSVFVAGYQMQATATVTSNGVWSKITGTFAMPSGHTHARLQVRVTNGGVVASAWVDNSNSAMTIPTNPYLPSVGFRSTQVNQSIPAATYTEVNLQGATDHDNALAYTRSGNVITLTAAGIYRIHGFAYFNNSTGNCRNIIHIECYTGTPALGVAANIKANDEKFGNTTVFNSINVVTTIALAAGTKVRLVAYQSSATAVDLVSGSVSALSQLNIEKIS